MAVIKSMLFKKISDADWNAFRVECTKANFPMTQVVGAFMKDIIDGNVGIERHDNGTVVLIPTD